MLPKLLEYYLKTMPHATDRFITPYLESLEFIKNQLAISALS